MIRPCINKILIALVFVTVNLSLTKSTNALPGCQEYCALYDNDKARCAGAAIGVMINENDGKEYACKPCSLTGKMCKGEVNKILEDFKPNDRINPCHEYCAKNTTKATCTAASLGLVRDIDKSKDELKAFGKDEYMCQPCKWTGLVRGKCSTDIDPSHKPLKDLKRVNAEFKEAYEAYEKAHPDEDDKKEEGGETEAAENE